MFIYRRVLKNGTGTQINTVLGDSYHLVTTKNKSSFHELARFHGNQEAGVFAFIVHHAGRSVIPLYKNSTHYIMTHSGQTFENITLPEGEGNVE